MSINVTSTIKLNLPVIEKLNKNAVKALEITADQLLTEIKNSQVMPFEAKILYQCIDDLEQLQKKWDKAVAEGIKTTNAKNTNVKNDKISMRDYTKIDLSTLDSEEIKVYNYRGWSYSLFNKEEIKLLNEKFSELLTSHKNEYIFADGTRIVEINNKIVLIGGTFENPQVHNVLVINAENETIADIFKGEIVYGLQRQRVYTRERLEEYWYNVEVAYGQDKVRGYSQRDFNYIKSRKGDWWRAQIPDDFKTYGYTKQYQQRTGDIIESEKGISTILLKDIENQNIKFQMRDDEDFLWEEILGQDIYVELHMLIIQQMAVQLFGNTEKMVL